MLLSYSYNLMKNILQWQSANWFLSCFVTFPFIEDDPSSTCHANRAVSDSENKSFLDIPTSA